MYYTEQEQEVVEQMEQGKINLSQQEWLRLFLAARGKINLTPREWEVLFLAAQGLSNQKIATLLCIVKHTVERHLESVNEKLGTTSRLEAALKVGLLIYTGPKCASTEQVRGKQQSCYVPRPTYNKNSGKPP